LFSKPLQCYDFAVSQNDHSLTLNSDLSVPDLLRALLERWYISERETLLHTLEHTTSVANHDNKTRLAYEEEFFDTHAALEQVRRDFEDEINSLGPRDSFIIRCWASGATPREIAARMNVSVTTVYARLKVLQKRVLYRSLKLADKHPKGKAEAPTSRLQAFEELQRSLSLTSAKAAEWQDAIHEARR
jgi:hypothetical protein